MSDAITLQVSQRGLLTLPRGLREQYNLKAGDEITLLDLGGVFVLAPRRTQIDAISEQITQTLLEGGANLESVLQVLREKRDQYGR